MEIIELYGLREGAELEIREEPEGMGLDCRRRNRCAEYPITEKLRHTIIAMYGVLA